MLNVLCLVLVVLGVGECSVEEVTIGEGDEVKLTTPDYPEHSQANWQKSWKITSPPGTTITLSCYDIRLFEDNPPECRTDVVVVEGGEKPLRICGTKYDLSLQTTDNVLKVEIKKGEHAGGGVSCTAALPMPPTTEQPPQRLEEEWVLQAGGEIKRMSSSNYPDFSPARVIQTWLLSTDPSSRIRVTCYDLRTVTVGGECSDVYMSVNDNGNETKVCGQGSGFTMLSSGPELKVEFKTGEHDNGGVMDCEAAGKIMDWYGESTPAPPPAYLGIESEEVDSSEHGGPPGPKATTCPCGLTNKDDKRIVNGKETKVNEYPWIVAVVDRERHWQFCGGSIITPYHVLTAAHCTAGFVLYNKLLSVIVGEHDLDTGEESNATQVIDVQRIIQHPDYEIYTKGEDITVLLLAKRVEFNKYVGPICISPTRLNLARQYVKIIGWGRMKDNKQTNLLQKVNVRVIHLETCHDVYKDVSIEKAVQICTYSHEKDSCQGDSGGPVVWLDPETNRYVLIGLVSFGRICGGIHPAVNTDVSAYYGWVQQTIKDTIPEETCSKVE